MRTLLAIAIFLSAMGLSGPQEAHAQAVTGFHYASASIMPEFDQCYSTSVATTSNNALDGNGFWYYGTPTYGVCYLNTSNQDYVTIPQGSEGWNWWVFHDNAIGANSGSYGTFQFKTAFGDTTAVGYSTAATTTYTLNTGFSDGSGLLLSRFDGPNLDQETEYRLYLTAIGQFNTLAPVYGVVYTNSDLSYINTRAEMYDYLYGNAPSNNPIDFTNYVPTQEYKYIEILAPLPYGTTTASTTVPVSVRFQTPLTLDSRPSTTRAFYIVDAITYEPQYLYIQELGPNIGENITISEDVELPPGSKILRAGYFDMFDQPYGQTDETFFNVATNTYLAATGRETPRGTAGNLSQINCDLFSIGCQFQKALTFLFTPSEGTLDKFTNTWQTIKSKRPIGYITVTMEQIKSLGAGGTPAFNLGTLPFMDTIFTPFRTLMAGILWGIFALAFYHYRLKHLEL